MILFKSNQELVKFTQKHPQAISKPNKPHTTNTHNS